LSKKGREFEEAFAKYLGSTSSVLTNSGSSANLLMLSALKSDQAPFQLKPGDEVITPACSFPTTFNPIVQNDFVPVLLDVELETYNINPAHLEKAMSKKTKAIFLPHMFGNPNQMDVIMDFAGKHNLIVLEDNCDSLGSKFRGKHTGTFGAMASHSFYPAHHITMGEGGAIALNQQEFEPVVRSLRDWGRACICPVCFVSLDPSFVCPMRFDQKIEGLPEGYDKKYIYSNIGFNLKPTEAQAAMGLVQLKKLEEFNNARKKNFNLLFKEFQNYEDYFILPKGIENSDVSWFCFPLTIRDRKKIARNDLVRFLEEENNIETRLFFSSNIIRHPAYKNAKYRVAEPLTNSDKILLDSFFIGTYPGITEEKMKFVTERIREFMKKIK
ncbi:MAG: lipopolysaccharide biosynthesis protein RfbH, partial [Candidatus Diapherotrites archaeon]|nr:lipopolysaccharide biosynthesis protein RfbH [Candidatus Diapherotrites archaeon]